MICASLLALMIFTSCAHAQDMAPHEGTGAAIGSIVISNREQARSPDPVFVSTVDIGGVPVTIRYESVLNNQPDPRDIVTVTAPDGFIAVPADVLLPEGESVEIVIYEALLG